MRALAAIVAMEDSGAFIVPPVEPYRWNSGVHDIEKTLVNAPLIAMAWVHEGGTPPAVEVDDLPMLREAAEAENSDAAAIEDWDAAQCDYAVQSNFVQYTNWYLILVACYQVRELKDSNIQNFCRMCTARSLPSKTGSFLAYWASRQARLVESDDVRNRFEANKFFEYHTTGSSTPKLCAEAMSEVLGLGIFTDSESRDVEEAMDSEYELELARKIDTDTLVKVSAVHEAAGTLPDTWYMGTKAVARFSGKKYSAMVKYLKAIFKLQTKTDGLDDMDLDTLVTNLKTLLDTFGGLTEASDSDSVGDDSHHHNASNDDAIAVNDV
jgi:hypothetical protein